MPRLATHKRALEDLQRRIKLTEPEDGKLFHGNQSNQLFDLTIYRVKDELKLPDKTIQLALKICQRVLKQSETSLNIYQILACFVLACKL